MTPLLIAVRTLHFCALAAAFGGAGFLLMLERRPTGAMALLRTATVLAGLTGAAWFALVFASIAGGPEAFADPEAWSAFAAAPFGPPWLIRLALCAVALVIGWGGAPVPVLGLGAALVIDQAWLGHAADGSMLGLVFYWLHVGAGFAWVGALGMLCVVGVAERQVPEDGIALFHRYGVALVATLVAGALVEASARGLTPGNLWATPYGQIVGGKSLALAAMLALALRHRLRRLEAPRLTLSIETALGLGVLALAAALGVTPPG